MCEEIKEIDRILYILKKHNALADEEDTYLLDYITSLQQNLKQLENIRKEAICYINKYRDDFICDQMNAYDLLDILNKGSE